MASYLATVQIGRYRVVEQSADVPMEVLVPPALAGKVEHAFGRQPEMLAVYRRLFGEYPYSSYRVVVTEDELAKVVDAIAESLREVVPAPASSAR